MRGEATATATPLSSTSQPYHLRNLTSVQYTTKRNVHPQTIPSSLPDCVVCSRLLCRQSPPLQAPLSLTPPKSKLDRRTAQARCAPRSPLRSSKTRSSRHTARARETQLGYYQYPNHESRVVSSSGPAANFTACCDCCRLRLGEQVEVGMNC